MALPLYAGRYQLEERLGQGGMGVVYRATDRRTGGIVAVKVITSTLATDPEYLERLRREARITASLTSPRVVRVIDLDEHNGAPFLVLEYVGGPTLDELLAEQGTFAMDEAVTICLEVARALEAAHARGIVHRDLKPDNIKLVDGQVKVLDFGIARAEAESGVTLTGTYLGTPYYSAPERIGGRCDIRSDIYAVGAILFELLTGTPPFDGPTPVAILMQHTTAPVPELPAEVPRPVRVLVSRCLAKSPADRYQTPAELVTALTAVLRAAPESAGSTSASRTTPRAPERPESTASGSGERPSLSPTIPARGVHAEPASPESTPGVAGVAGSSPTMRDATAAIPAGPGAEPPEDERRKGRASWRSRHRVVWVTAGAALVLLVAVAVAAGLLRQNGEATPSEPPPPPVYAARAEAARVVTLAGSGAAGVVDGPGLDARFVSPVGVAVDGGGTLYVVDEGRIRRVSPAGEVVTLAGSDEAGFADGPVASARFSSPKGIAVDGAGTLYIADRDNHRIRVLSRDGVVRTLAGTGLPGLADGPGDGAQFNEPYDVAVDAAGTVYVADALNNRIRRISPQGVVTTLAGGGESGDHADGPGALARFSFPSGLTVDAVGTVYVADTYNARIRAVSAGGNVRTVAGSGEDGTADGPAALAEFSDPSAVAVDGSGNLYVLDESNRIRLISPGGEVRTLAGSGEHGFTDAPATEARFDMPEGIAATVDGTVYVADTGNRRIRTVPASP